MSHSNSFITNLPIQYNERIVFVPISESTKRNKPVHLYNSENDLFEIAGPVIRGTANSDFGIDFIDNDPINDVYFNVLKEKALSGSLKKSSWGKDEPLIIDKNVSFEDFINKTLLCGLSIDGKYLSYIVMEEEYFDKLSEFVNLEYLQRELEDEYKINYGRIGLPIGSDRLTLNPLLEGLKKDITVKHIESMEKVLLVAQGINKILLPTTFERYGKEEMLKTLVGITHQKLQKINDEIMDPDDFDFDEEKRKIDEATKNTTIELETKHIIKSIELLEDDSVILFSGLAGQKYFGVNILDNTKNYTETPPKFIFPESKQLIGHSRGYIFFEATDDDIKNFKEGNEGIAMIFKKKPMDSLCYFGFIDGLISKKKDNLDIVSIKGLTKEEAEKQNLLMMPNNYKSLGGLSKSIDLTTKKENSIDETKIPKKRKKMFGIFG